MQSLVRIPLLLLLLGVTRAFCAQSPPGLADTTAANKKDAPACIRYLAVPLPPGDAPAASDISVLKDCHSESLYYGFNSKRDSQAALRCAYAERQQNAGLIFGESAVLMMLYANGLGVPRNYDVALHFACEVEGAPAETEGRIAHLEKLKARHAVQTRFDLCDDITSGFMEGACTAREADKQQYLRDAKLTALQSQWTPEQREAFVPLKAAADVFFKAKSDNEVDLSGTGRAAFAIEEEESLRKSFLAALQRFAAGRLPVGSAADLRVADARLNRLYAAALQQVGGSKEEFGPFGTIHAEGIRATQRLWIPYRDAWVAFAAKEYPQVSADAFRNWLTTERANQLDEFATRPQ